MISQQRGFRTTTVRTLLLAAMTLAATTATAIAQTTHHYVLANSANLPDGAKELPHDFNNATSAGNVTHLTVGRSMFIDTKHRLTKVYLTNPTLLTSYTSSPNQVVVTALKAGTSTFIVWDENGESQTYLISNDIDVAGLRDALKQRLSDAKITVSANEDRVELSGTVGKQETADEAVKLANVYAKDVVSSIDVNAALVKQIRLKVRFIEVDRTKAFQFGLNILSTNGNTLFGSSTQQFPSAWSIGSPASSTGGTSALVGGTSVSVTNPLNFTVFSSKYNIGASLQDLETKNVLQILAEPTMTAMSGEKASFLAGGEFPFPVVQSSAGSLASITIQFRPYGVKLDFTPTVNADGTVTLKIAPEVSALDYSNAVTISGYTIPALSTRRADTEVVLRSGQSFAISGLLDQRTTENLNRTPGISSVPILGLLFKSKNNNRSITELLVVVTPEVIDPTTEKNNDPADDPKNVLPSLSGPKFDQQINKPFLKQ